MYSLTNSFVVLSASSPKASLSILKPEAIAFKILSNDLNLILLLINVCSLNVVSLDIGNLSSFFCETKSDWSTEPSRRWTTILLYNYFLRWQGVPISIVSILFPR